MGLFNRVHGIIIFTLMILGLTQLCSPAFADPVPTITANTGTSRVLVMPGTQFDLSIEFDPQEDLGANADWWLYAEISGTYFYYNLNAGWVPGFKVSAQGPLANLPSFNVLSVNGLPPGTYNISFGVDLNMNGRLGDDAYLDTIEVKVPGYSCPDTENSMDALSDDQKAFIASRGTPDMFVLGFINEEIDSQNRPAYLANDNIRRLEYWYYNREDLIMSQFDSGYFVQESKVGEAVSELQSVQFSPSQLSPCMERSDIVALVGEPSCTYTDPLANSTYSYLRYNPTASRPASTFVLENGVLVTVLAGYSLDLDSDPNDGNLCTD